MGTILKPNVRSLVSSLASLEIPTNGMFSTSSRQQQKHFFLPSTANFNPFSHLQLLLFFPPIYLTSWYFPNISHRCPKHPTFGSSLANPSRFCPSMAVMVQPAVRCGCPGFSSTRSTCIPQQVGVSSTPAPRSGSTRRYGFSGSDLPLPLPLPFLGKGLGVGEGEGGKTLLSFLGTMMKLVIFHLNECGWKLGAHMGWFVGWRWRLNLWFRSEHKAGWVECQVIRVAQEFRSSIGSTQGQDQINW